MFWGLQLEPNLRYSQQVPEAFRITKATLHPENEDKPRESSGEVIQVFVEQDGSDYAIATLRQGQIYDCSLDLRFQEGEDICFHLKGEAIVYLTGHILHPKVYEDDSFYLKSSSSDEDEEDIDEEEDDSEDDGPEIEDITELNRSNRKAISAANGTIAAAAAKLKAMEFDVKDDDEDEEDEDFDESDDPQEDISDVDEEDVDDDEEDDDELEDDDEDEEEQKIMKTKLVPGQKRSGVPIQLQAKSFDAKKAKLQNGTPSSGRLNGDAARVAEPTKSPHSAKKAAAPQTNESVKELVIEDVKVGTGPVAKKGKTVQVYYTGTLLNGKKFDSLVAGKPFQFKLGTASVIKGWDKGLEGMKVGGKRRLLIPSSMAYGRKKMGPIPAQSALKFEVELKAVSG